MDATQLLLTIILTISAVLALVLGIQLFLVLKELRKALKNINTIVEGFESVGMGLEHGLGEVVGFFNGAKTIFKAIDLFSKKDGRSKQS